MPARLGSRGHVLPIVGLISCLRGALADFPVDEFKTPAVASTSVRGKPQQGSHGPRPPPHPDVPHPLRREWRTSGFLRNFVSRCSTLLEQERCAWLSVEQLSRLAPIPTIAADRTGSPWIVQPGRKPLLPPNEVNEDRSDWNCSNPALTSLTAAGKEKATGNISSVDTTILFIDLQTHSS